jgi:two-component system LytT family response regulator
MTAPAPLERDKSHGLLRTIDVLIVDSDVVARAQLRKLISGCGIPCEVDEANDRADAVIRVRSRDFDIVFLDVSLVDCDGFQLIQAVGSGAAVAYAFATAIEGYALEPFDVRAVGYLTKPLSALQVAEVIEYVARRRDRVRATFGGGESALIDAVSSGSGRRYLTRLVVRQRGRVVFVRAEDVDWIEAANTCVRVHTPSETFDVRERLSVLERRLSPRDFARVHRGAIVRVDRIREVQPWFRGDYVIILASGQKITTGHSYRGVVRALLEHR